MLTCNVGIISKLIINILIFGLNFGGSFEVLTPEIARFGIRVDVGNISMMLVDFEVLVGILKYRYRK